LISLQIMAKPMDAEKIADFLGETRDDAPAEVQHVFLTLEDLWERKLWHQLTETLLEYYADPQSESQRLPMYNTFILSFADKINQLKLVTLGLSASQQLKGNR
jgi:26S proteasome regulatory subunit N9